MMTNSRVVPLLCTVVLLSVPAVAQAQDPPQPPQEEVGDLVFEREVFQYPAFTRRNPFAPLTNVEGGPRYEQLTLIGIMYSADPSLSVAVLTTGGVTVNEDGTVSATEGDAYYLKSGESVGNVTVVEVGRQQVVVDVEEFGLVDRKTMVFISRRQGGTQ